MKTLIQNIVNDSIDTKKRFFNRHDDTIRQTVTLFTKTFGAGGKILLFGNGGSAADCQHIAAEFVNRFQMERIPLPALALTTDTSVITSIGNDYSFDDIFQKQVQALGSQNDIALGISTSGASANVISGIETARDKEMTTICFSGNTGTLKDLCDISFCVDSTVTARIQEVHMLLGHILCDLTERELFHG